MAEQPTTSGTPPSSGAATATPPPAATPAVGAAGAPPASPAPYGSGISVSSSGTALGLPTARPKQQKGTDTGRRPVVSQADSTFLSTKVRRSLALKILVLLLGLAIVTLAFSASISLYSLNGVRDVANDGNEALGKYAEVNSKQALVKVAEEDLQRRVLAQAESSDSIFRRVESETKQLALIAQKIWNEPRFGATKQTDPPAVEPADKFSTTSYVLAPGVKRDDPEVDRDMNFSYEMDRAFMAVLANDQVPVAVHVSTVSGLLRTFPWRSGWAADFDPRTRDWFIQPIKNKGIAWTSPYISKSTNRLIVTVSAPFYNADGSVRGVIKVDITPQTINDAIINLHVGQNGYAFLVDSTGVVIASPQMDALDRMCADISAQTGSSLDKALRQPTSYNPVNLAFATEHDLKTVGERMLRKESGLILGSLEGHQSYIAYAPVPSTGWSIGLVMPYSEIVAPAAAIAKELKTEAARSRATIDSHLSESMTLLGLLLTVMLLAASWAALSMSRRITQPIRTLSAGTGMLGAGDLDHHIVIRTGDEIELLANDFNAMAANLKTYIANIGEATAARERVESELQIARKIQSSLLPRIFPAFPERKEMDLYACMEAAREVGGDFYDFFLVDQDRLCMAIGDVSDKGIPASLFMAVTKTLIKTEALQPGRTAGDILNRVNNQLCDENEMLMFVTVFLVIVNLKTGELEYANAGHNPAVICRAGQPAEFMKPKKGVALAVMPDAFFKVERATLNPGDVLFIYTDGVNEAMNIHREQFSYPRLLSCLDRTIQGSAQTITQEMRNDIRVFADTAPQSDDITIITLRYHGIPAT